MSQIALAADFAIIVVVATVIGILARQFGQPTIIAYILTGVILGPVVFGIVGPEDPLVESMAELGLGFLLFLLGMKMRFDDIREILRPITNVAIGQTVLQTALAFLVAWVLGFDTTEILVIALATVFGATPIIVKILTDKDEITSLPGKIDVGVLIVQDIYLVVVLALFAADSLETGTEIATTLGVIFVMMAFIGIFSIASSRYFLPRLFRRIADNKDVFLLVAIAWAFLFIFIAEEFELSVEVGAFLAGISLAQLPYSKELEDRITPITDFFILVFFASIGLQIDGVNALLAYWWQAIVASVVLMVGNFWIMFYLIDREGFSVETSFLGSINMVQVSEFSLVVGALAFTQGYIGSDILGYLSLMALLTMSVSTYIVMYNHEIYERVRPWFERFDSDEKTDTDLKTYEDHAIAIGYDEITESALSLLKEKYGNVVVIDRKTDHIEELEAEDEYDYIFGDFRHREVRKAANLKDANFVLSSSVEVDVNKVLLEEVDDDATVFVEAERIDDARDLYDRGANCVVMSTYLSAEKMNDYLRTYFEDRRAFTEAIRPDVERIQRRGRLIDSADVTDTTRAEVGGDDDD
ncbi:cation:proton antiporter [Natronobacterium gregoryi]|uniref:Kef-type K+ transport system, membrane component n=2 Tax=Natronobacterium gregoryi TaxID=44930 RepID=L0AKU9_NATGS|nr:cation:proton antiporter [Natronobacterium gregoryi]AFZ73655.1 Kef-type K+ transport system, membrane component [Natronobacterium gregoryi SP2]ELY67848.1 sodium/hydrogen exchanger [Natronobacterium gregoryi SP2]PLK19621.1 potassium transporter Kef [Natronobacterium gregoryi SP2]SFJ00378.1 transporter, CPA2 family [Natronobacterium gregoryi]